MVSNDRGETLDDDAASRLLRQRLPEFEPAIDEHLEDNFGELLFHNLMGDLARFYMTHAQHNRELQRRYWMAVDSLADHGDDSVQNAIGVSLIEWFAWGSAQERMALISAKPQMSRLVRSIADEFLRAGGYDDRGRPRASEQSPSRPTSTQRGDVVKARP